MCLAIPALVTQLLPDQMARISLDGVTKIISVMLVEDVVPGDYVIVHVGHALARIRRGRSRAYAGAARRGGGADANDATLIAERRA